ncbi:InlB B-repeat-containing protein [Vagococcus carniphilus]|uniref:InlB B-repeat-containing protein n=1 Tax=Vagococcus carniphilus TaxID=218144 RepID=UPI00289072D0|nr:InlB B-repeat-containing protein [Vagococcus carniphilus]MDT2814962.1 InlB B-repeat-containing protein [Vagococcus carniphilus]
MKLKKELCLLFCILLFLSGVKVKAEAYSSEVEENTSLFSEELLSKERVMNESLYYMILADDEIFYLKEEEFNTFQEEETDYQIPNELKEGVIESVPKEKINFSYTNRSFSNYFNWNNWQTDSEIKASTEGSIKRKNISGNNWSTNFLAEFELTQLNATKPIIALMETRNHVVNAQILKNPTYSFSYPVSGNLGYYDLNKTQRVPMIRVPGSANYLNGVLINGVKRSAIVTKLNNDNFFFHPNTVGDKVNVDVAYNYSTPAKNGYNDSLNSPPKSLVVSRINPQLVKAVHVDNKTGKVIQNVENYGLKKGLNDSVTINNKNFSNYNFKSYDVYRNGEFVSSSNSNTWQGNLTRQKRGIVFKYAPIYTVSFESNGGSRIVNQRVEDSKKATQPINPTYANKKFEGWYEDKGLTKKFDFNQPITGDKVLYAKWTSIHTVSFESNGGSKVTSQKVENNKKATQPTNPTYDNKRFEGWYEDKGLTKKYDFNQPITGDKVLYAKWTSIHTVSFESNGGSKVTSQKVENNKKATQPTNPTYANKKFEGWYEDKGLTQKYDFNQLITGDKVLYAKWRSKILDPIDGKTPVTPIIEDEEKPQNKTQESLRIQYVSDFDFLSVINSYLSIEEISLGDTVRLDDGKVKHVPAFVSVIDDRPGQNKGWRLQAKASSFKNSINHEINGAELYLSNLNFSKNLTNAPLIENETVNLSNSVTSLISQKAGTHEEKSWSLAFGELTKGNKTSGVSLKIPSGTQKNNEEYFSVIDWQLVPLID